MAGGYVARKLPNKSLTHAQSSHPQIRRWRVVPEVAREPYWPVSPQIGDISSNIGGVGQQSVDLGQNGTSVDRILPSFGQRWPKSATCWATSATFDHRWSKFGQLRSVWANY